MKNYVIAHAPTSRILLALGYILFAEIPSAAVLVGAAIVIASGIFIILREHYLGIERARARREKLGPTRSNP